jgi:hypothetical protein
MTNKLTHSGNIIMAGFFCMVLFMSFLVYKCMMHRPDMVSADYYQKELHFQENINAQVNAAAYEFKVAAKAQAVELIIPKELAATMQDATITFYCAADSRQDKLVNLVAGNGVFNISTKGWKSINYIAKISLVSEGKKYYREIPVAL